MKKTIRKFVNIARGIDETDILYSSYYINPCAIDKSKIMHKELILTMLKGCKVLEDLGIKYSLGRGTVLGFHRDKTFLPSDTDIDIDIFEDNNIFQIIKTLPFDPFLVSYNKGHYQQFALIDKETNVVFDIWFYYEKRDKLINRNHWGHFWLPLQMINNLTSIRIEGHSYPIPDPESYCTFWYGKNWRTPAKYHEDWTIDYRRDCSGFIYTGWRNVVEMNYF